MMGDIERLASAEARANAAECDRDVAVDALKQVIGPLRRGVPFVPTDDRSITACRGLVAVGCMVETESGHYQMSTAATPTSARQTHHGDGPMSKGQFSRRLKAAARAAGATRTDQVEISFEERTGGLVSVSVRFLVTDGAEVTESGSSVTLVANNLSVEYLDGVAKRWGGVIAATELSVCQKTGVPSNIDPNDLVPGGIDR
jgi:hypothetical protein